MRKIETSVWVAEDGNWQIAEPVRTDMPPGRHRAVVFVVEDKERPVAHNASDWSQLDFSDWPADAKFTRDELYRKLDR